MSAASLPISAWFTWQFLAGATAGVRAVPFAVRAIPLGYLLEGTVLNALILVALSLVRCRGEPLVRVIWASLGALAALSILGAWSIGYMFVPGLLLGLVAGASAALRRPTGFARPLAWLLAGFAGQIAIMLIVIGLAVSQAPRP